jgi:microcompartment protein CcmL/EutN
MIDALGIIETNSVPKGIEGADAMLKAAAVDLVSAQTACAGKYIAVVSGEVAAVKAAVEAGSAMAQEALVDSVVISNLYPEVITALNSCLDITGQASIGIIETFSLASAVLAADYAVKAADIKLIQVRLGNGLGGKSFVVIAGEVAAVHHAAETAVKGEGTEGNIARMVVIPSPHPEIVKSIC